MSVQGTGAVGTHFRWRSGPQTIRSTIERLEWPQVFGWHGQTFGISENVVVWRIEPRAGGSLVRQEMRAKGWLSRLIPKLMQSTLQGAVDEEMRCLKAEVERKYRV